MNLNPINFLDHFESVDFSAFDDMIEVRKIRGAIDYVILEHDLRDENDELLFPEDVTPEMIRQCDMRSEDGDFLVEVVKLYSALCTYFGASDMPDYLIRDSHFEDYARELHEEISGEVMNDWPFTHIDWQAAAEDIQTDYTAFEFFGVAYWGRA